MDIVKNVDAKLLNSQDEFVMMLQRNESLINRLCYALGDHSAYCTDELFQEVCIRLWRGWNGYKGIGLETTFYQQCKVSSSARFPAVRHTPPYGHSSPRGDGAVAAWMSVYLCKSVPINGLRSHPLSERGARRAGCVALSNPMRRICNPTNIKTI